MMRSTVFRRFLDRAERVPSGCWEWLASKDKGGYGRYHVGNFLTAHRFSYWAFIGDIPTGMFVLHQCDNRGCVNPDHLLIGTQKDNAQDMINKGRGFNQKKTHCKYGHKFTKENTQRRNDSRNNSRVCAECHRVDSLKSYHKHRESK